MFRPILIAIVTLVLFGGCSTVNDSGMIHALRVKAAHGDPAAQVQLAAEYDQGIRVGRDLDKAVKWYRAAAEQGNAAGQNSMGSLYQAGDGVPQDHKQAMDWYRKAADQGDATGKNNLAYMYDLGLGTPEDNREAAQLYEKAAELGEIRAMLNLGVLLRQGQSGVDEDYVEAYKWLDLAMLYTQGSRNKRLKRSARRALDDLSGMMTSVQIEQAKKLSKEWDQIYRTNGKSD